MNPLDSLPDEILQNVCNQMSPEQLISFQSSNWRMYNFCKDIAIQRIVDDIMSGINNPNVELVEFNNLQNGSTVQIQIYENDGKIKVDISQSPIEVIWPFSDIKWSSHRSYIEPYSNEKGNLYRSTPRTGEIVDRKRLTEMVNTLLDQGYIYSA